MIAAGQDPRDTLPPPDDIRPVVAVPRGGLSNVAIAIGIAVLALVLFVVLDARRRALITPERTGPVNAAANSFAPAPPLALPPAPPPLAPVVIERIGRSIAPPPSAPPAPPAPVYQPTPPKPYMQPPPPDQPRTPGGGTEPAMVVDLTPADNTAGPGAPPGTASDDTAVRASIIRNRGSLVPQGTLIAAVLETPIDSSRPGLARAIVSRDARGFDGSRVLIPRGSRLIGEYRSDVAPGQRRVLVTWSRLVRPDGVAIRIGSPSADSLGGAGIAGRVNTHFFQRFANAVLQSALTVGVNLASQPRGGSNAVFVGVPGQVANVGQSLFPNVSPNPTIKVRQGAEIAIFVARDLDFGGTAPRQ